MAEQAAAPREYFDLYYIPLDTKIQLVAVFDQYRGECYLGLLKTGKQLIVSAPLNVWQDLHAEIKAKARRCGGKLTIYDDRFGINCTCYPDIHSKQEFASVSFTQPITRMEAAIGSVYKHRPGYTDRALHQMTMCLATYELFCSNMDFVVKLFRVLRISKQPDVASDENTIQPEFRMCLKPKNEALEFRMSITPVRFANMQQACIEIKQEKVAIPGQLGVPEVSIRLGVDYLKQVETFNARDIRMMGYGLLMIRDSVGNNIEPPLIVYPHTGDLPESCHWPKSVQKALCFTYEEWRYFAAVVEMFKAWYHSGNGFYGTGW